MKFIFSALLSSLLDLPLSFLLEISPRYPLQYHLSGIRVAVNLLSNIYVIESAVCVVVGGQESSLIQPYSEFSTSSSASSTSSEVRALHDLHSA